MPNPGAGQGVDALGCLGERAAGCFDRGQFRQPVRVHAGRHVQHRVGDVQIGDPGPAVGDPGRGDLPEHRGQDSAPAVLDPRAPDPLGTYDLGHAGLGQRPQGQVVLEQAPRDLPHPRSQHVLQLRVRHRRGARPGEIGRHLVEQPARGGERVLGHRQRAAAGPGRAHRAPVAASANSPGSGSARTPRSVSRLSFCRIVSTREAVASSPSAVHTSLHRNGPAVSANTAAIRR